MSKFLLAMENIDEDQEVQFEWTKSFCILPKTCSIHGVGMKNLELQKYTCPNC